MARHGRSNILLSHRCTRRVAFTYWITLLILGMALVVFAQEPSLTDMLPTSNTQTTSLTGRQSIIRDHVGRLEDRLFQLSQVLRTTNPDKADQLVEALSTSRSRLVRQQIGRIIQELEDRQFADAMDQQQAVTAGNPAHLLNPHTRERATTVARRKQMGRIAHLTGSETPYLTVRPTGETPVPQYYHSLPQAAMGVPTALRVHRRITDAPRCCYG